MSKISELKSKLAQLKPLIGINTNLKQINDCLKDNELNIDFTEIEENCELNYIKVNIKSINCLNERSDQNNEKIRVEPINCIFNGRDAKVGESPWTVGLDITFEKISQSGSISYFSQRCSGSLITFEWILTAAHCLKENEF